MRKIETLMWQAINNRTFWKLGNTAVDYIGGPGESNPYGPRSEVFLHGNHIATFWHDTQQVEVNERTLCNWPTPTTKSRLRALGVNVCTRNHTTFLDGVAV